MPVRHDHHVLPLGAEVVDFHHVVLHDKKKTHKFLGLHDSFWLPFVANISAKQPSSPNTGGAIITIMATSRTCPILLQ